MTVQRNNQEVVVIRPRVRGKLSLQELAASRYMFWNLVKTSALSPYAELLLGFFWTFAQPFIFVLVIVFLRNMSGANMGHGVEYVLFVYSGLVLWWYFVDATKQSMRCFYKYRGLVTKVYYSRIITPAVPIFARLFELILRLLAIIPLMFYYNHFPDANFMLLPLVILHTMLIALGLGYAFSILSFVLKDFERALDFLLYAAFFVSPVMFSGLIVPEAYRAMYNLLNPMAMPLATLRSVLFSGGDVDFSTWLISGGIALAIFSIGFLFFTRHEGQIAEGVS